MKYRITNDDVDSNVSCSARPCCCSVSASGSVGLSPVAAADHRRAVRRCVVHDARASGEVAVLTIRAGLTRTERCRARVDRVVGLHHLRLYRQLDRRVALHADALRSVALQSRVKVEHRPLETAQHHRRASRRVHEAEHQVDVPRPVGVLTLVGRLEVDLANAASARQPVVGRVTRLI